MNNGKNVPKAWFSLILATRLCLVSQQLDRKITDTKDPFLKNRFLERTKEQGDNVFDFSKRLPIAQLILFLRPLAMLASNYFSGW